MIYLDYSATSNKKPRKVITTYYKTLKNLSVNASRGAYPLSIQANLKILETRNNISNFFNLNSPENVVFTSGCTESLNLALIGTALKNGHIITSTFEHNSVLRTLNHIKTNFNIDYSIVTPKFNNTNITVNDIEKHIKSNTYLVVINQTSNVNGASCDINKIGKFCKGKNLIFVVDGAQSAGHELIDIKNNNINLLCVAGHKGLYGPQGIGALLINNINLKPIKFGGTGTESENLNQPSTPPESFESGTLNLPGILSFNEGIKFVSKNINKINEKIYKLSYLLNNELRKISDINVFNSSIKSGVYSLKPKYKSIDDLYNYLCSKKICTRNGLHCAPLAHKFLSTINSGLIRISIGYYTTKKEIKILIKEIKKFIYK